MSRTFFGTLGLILHFTCSVLAQEKTILNHTRKFQYGFSIQASATIEHRRPVLKLVGNAGIALEILRFFYPSYNLQVQLYNGGYGTRYFQPDWKKPYIDIDNAITFTAGVNRSIEWMAPNDYINRNSPLYYFTDFCYPALQNIYNYSLSLGTNYIIAFGPGRSRLQKVGFLNLHINQFQLAYANDGTPFQNILFGDGKDRYYTGDGFLSVNLRRDLPVNIFRMSYHKFTGYSPDAFEVSNSLFLNDVIYKDNNQQQFNRSIYSFGIGNSELGIYLAAECRNKYRKDMQHNIHRDGFYTIHQTPYRYAWGFTANYFFTNSLNTSDK